MYCNITKITMTSYRLNGYKKLWHEKRSKTEVFDLKLLIFTLISDIAKPASQCGSNEGTCRRGARSALRRR